MNTVKDPETRRKYMTAFRPANHREYQRKMVGRPCSDSCILCEIEFSKSKRERRS